MLSKPKKLDPKNIHFEKNDRDQLVMKNSEGEKKTVKVKSPFPLTSPYKYIVIQDEEGEFIGLVKGMKFLDPKSRAIIDEELDYSYFLPKITKIESIIMEYEIMVWKVQTNRGPKTFEVRSTRRDIRWLNDNHIVIQDADANRYEIPDLDKLDIHSRSKLEMEV